jgi:signal transduction histidine kinase
VEKNPAHPQDAHSPGAPSGEQIKDLVAQAQHDLRNPLGHILCFCELLIPQAQQLQDESLKQGLNTIDATATQMVKDINRVLDPNQTPSSPEAVARLQGQLRQQASDILITIPTLLTKDLTRMSDSAKRVSSLVETALSFYAPRK